MLLPLKDELEFVMHRATCHFYAHAGSLRLKELKEVLQIN